MIVCHLPVGKLYSRQHCLLEKTTFTYPQTFSIVQALISLPLQVYLPKFEQKSMTSNQWLIGPIRNPTLKWGDYHQGQRHTCRTCDIELLTGEKSRFCCGPNGSHYQNVPVLPPLPDEIQAITTHPDISRLSRMLNLIFSFASLETTHPFPSISGPPGFLAIQGCVYHCIRPTHANSAI